MVEDFEFIEDVDLATLLREPRLMVILNHGTPISWVPPICLLTEKACAAGGADRISRGVIDKFFYSNPITQPIAEYVTQSKTPQTFQELLEQFRAVERTDLVIFPEGAMTFFGNVHEIQPFRSPRFLEIAIRANAPLLVAVHRGTEDWNLRLPLPLELVQTIGTFSKFFGSRLEQDSQINLPLRLKKVPHFRMKVRRYDPALAATELSPDPATRRDQLMIEAARLRTTMQEMFDSLA